MPIQVTQAGLAHPREAWILVFISQAAVFLQACPSCSLSISRTPSSPREAPLSPRAQPSQARLPPLTPPLLPSPSSHRSLANQWLGPVCLHLYRHKDNSQGQRSWCTGCPYQHQHTGMLGLSITRCPFHPRWKFPRAQGHSLPSPGHLPVLRRGAGEATSRGSDARTVQAFLCAARERLKNRSLNWILENLA